MNDWQPILPGVLVHEYDLDTSFTRGSLSGLAEGLRDAIWQHIELFESSEVIRVLVGGNHRNSLEPVIEVVPGESGRTHGVDIPKKLDHSLRKARTRNLPTSENARWECTCNVYCDQAHGEGRIELRILKPTFHELAVLAE